MKKFILFLIGLFLMAGLAYYAYSQVNKASQERKNLSEMMEKIIQDQAQYAQNQFRFEQNFVNQEAMQGYTIALMDNFRAIVDGYDKLRCEVDQHKKTTRTNIKVLKDKDAELMKTVESYSLDNETKFEQLLNALIDKEVCCPPLPEQGIIYQYYPFEVEKEVIRYIDNTDTKIEYLWNSRTIIEHDKCETIPEPGTSLMLGGGLVGLGLWRKR